MNGAGGESSPEVTSSASSPGSIPGGGAKIIHAAQPKKMGTTLPQQVVPLKKKKVDGFPAVQFYPAGKISLDLCIFCNSIRPISNNTGRSPSEVENQPLGDPESGDGEGDRRAVSLGPLSMAGKGKQLLQ